VAQDASSNRQPIIAPPEVTLHPSGGRMVLFGTGKYIETGDIISMSTQSFYGVWDDNSAVAGRSSLDQKLVGTVTVGGDDYRTISSGTTLSSPKGWYVDFSSGERVTGIPKLRSGLIYYNTFTPTTGTPCAPDGDGWLMVQNYLTGDLPGSPVFDTNGDGEIDDEDTAVAGLNVGAAIGGSTLISGATGSATGAVVTSLNDGSTNSEPGPPEPGSRGRIAWREIVQ
jgi:type IV pilus assembly protein PilY1